MDLDRNEFTYLHISIRFNGTDVVPNRSDYPTFGSSTAITYEGLVTFDLEAHRFFHIGFFDAADVYLVYSIQVYYVDGGVFFC